MSEAEFGRCHGFSGDYPTLRKCSRPATADDGWCNVHRAAIRTGEARAKANETRRRQLRKAEDARRAAIQSVNDGLRAQLAQRDKELAALREKVNAAKDWLRDDEHNCPDCEYAAQMATLAAFEGYVPMPGARTPTPGRAPSCEFHEGAHRFLSVLSNDQEGE